MGTPDFAVPTCQKLMELANVILIVTQPDKEVGRKKELRMSPIKKVALANNIAVFQPSKIREDFALIKSLEPDLIVTCAYGQILPQELLDIPRLGCINVHASLLPKYRGSAPIQHALLNGEKETGITLMYMDAGMDTGDIIAKQKYVIKNTDNCGTLHDILSEMGANLLAQNWDDIVSGCANREKQDDNLATIAPRITRDDELIDLNSSGFDIINKIRALNPWPLAYLKGENYEFKVLEAIFKAQAKGEVGKIEVTKDQFGIHVKDGIIYLQKIKPIGKKEMDIKDFLHGWKGKKNE